MNPNVLLPLLADLLAGAFLCNCIPHLASGLQGRAFPTPFARPPGRGDSSPVVNVIWGISNLVVGLLLLGFAPVRPGFGAGFLTCLGGALTTGLLLAWHFGAVMAARKR